MRSAARFDLSGKLFQSLAPVYEKLFWPFEEICFGIPRSVALFLSFYKELVEFATKNSIRYCGASPLVDSKCVDCICLFLTSKVLRQGS